MKINNLSDRDLFFSRVQPKEYPYILEWKPYEEDKSNEQRAWFHRLCRELGNHVGSTEGDIKQIVLAKKFGTKPVLRWGLTIVVPDIPYKSTEQMPKRLYSELIELVYQLGAEADVILPNPE